MVGMTRFELAASCTPCKRATRLRYIPTKAFVYRILGDLANKKPFLLLGRAFYHGSEVF